MTQPKALTSEQLDAVSANFADRVTDLFKTALAEHFESNDPRAGMALMFGAVNAVCEISWAVRRPGANIDELANAFGEHARQYLTALSTLTGEKATKQ